MNKPAQPTLTKTCMNCGKQKPLSAFLEMSSTQGTTYGNICVTCRKTALENDERRKKTDAEGSTTIETGHKIDSKTKVHSAIDKREQFQRTEEEYYEDRKIDKEISTDTQDIKQTLETSQKKHREEFLRQRRYLSDETKPRQMPTDQPREVAATQAKNSETTAKEIRENVAAGQKTESELDERKKTGLDFTVAFQGQQIAGQLRFSGEVYQRFRQWLGSSAPIVNKLNQTLKEVAPKNPGAIAEPAKQLQHSELKPAQKTTADQATEFIEKNWRPGSKR